MPHDVRQSKPTCTTCPFFYRPKAASIGDPGDCLYGRSTPVPMGANPQGGLLIGVMRPRTTPDATCIDHPAMAGWLAKTYPRPALIGVDLASGRDSTVIHYGKSPERPDRDDDRETEPDIHAHAEPDDREREEDQVREREDERNRLAGSYANELARETAENRSKSPIIAGTLGGPRPT